MSYTYLQEQGGESLAESFADIPAYVLSRLNLSAAKSCCNASAMGCCQNSRYGMTSEHSTGGHGADLLTSLPAGSLAKTFQDAGKAPELKASGQVYGAKWRGLSVRFDRASCSWKTHQCLFQEDLEPSLLTFPKWGRMSAGGELSELMIAPLRISASDSGLSEYWPTPLSRDWKDTPGMALEGVNPDGTDRNRTDTLPRAVWIRARAMFPTPRASDADKGGRGDLLAVIKGRPNKHSGRMWPKPRAMEGGPDFAKMERGKRTGQSVSPSLATAVALDGGAGLGPLNPQFREWLMGWPIDWSAKKPLGMDRFQEWLRQHGKY